MLRSLRDNAKAGFLKYILMGFLVLAGGGLVLTDVGGFFRGGVAATDVAKVGDIKISARDFDNTLRRLLSRDASLSPQQAYQMGITESILQSMINNSLLGAAVADAGLRIGNEEVKRQILEITNTMTLGDESPKQILQRILRQQNMSEGDFIESVRAEAATAVFQNAIKDGTSIIPDPLLAVIYAAENEMRDISLLHLKNSDIKNSEQPSDEALQTYYEANKISYLIPESREVTLAILNNEMLKDRVEITDEELRNIYDTDIASFTKPQRRSIEQSIVSEQAQAEAILKQAQEGKALNTATKNVTGSGSAYQAASNFEESGLLDDIAKPIFEAAIGDVVGPIQTPLGWHVLKLQKILLPEVTPFKDVKKDIKDTLLSERLIDEMVDTANAIDDSLAGGETLDNVVKEYGLTTQKIGSFRDTGLSVKGNKDVFESFANDRVDIIDAAFGFDEGEVAPILELSDGRFLSIRIDAVKPQSYTPYEDVKSEIRTKWINDQKALDNRARAQDAFAALQSGDKSLKTLSSDLGVRIKKVKGVKQSDPKDSNLGLDSIGQLFELPEGKTFMAPVSDGYMIVRLDDITIPSFDNAKDDDKSSIQDAATRAIPNEVLNQYINALASDKKISVNRALLDQMYGASSESF